MKRNIFFVIFLIFVLSNLFSANITINTTSGRQAISPFIYGTNQLMEGGENTTLYRLGGNRLTGYNWENNYSNAGSDWYHTSDTWLCSSNYGYGTDCNQPGGLIRRFHQESLSMGMQSIITVPMAGYVAADQAGTVIVAQTAPSSRWKQVIPKKPSAFVYPPDLTDNYVYVDEEVNYLVSQFGNASTPTGVKFYALDNEPALWNETHPRIHPTPCYAVELINRSTATAKAIKDVDPYCEIFGPVFFGFWSMNDLQNPPDWASEKGSYQWYVDYYLAKMKQASDAEGRRLLDALDFHWYSEARAGQAPPFTYSTPGVCRITEDTCTSSAAQIARMQAPRTLWDPTYVENSPIAQWYAWALPIIPKVQNSINTYYPETKIAITEFAHGGGNDYSGGVSMADTLGIFGKYGVYAATMWKTAYGPYHSAAYKIFRNYNGANGKYGDTKVYCESNDIPNMTAYASINGSDESELHIIVINKAGTNQTANVNITSGLTYTSAECWGFGGASYNITSRTAPVLSGNSFSYSVPAYSVLHFVIKSNATPTRTPVVTNTITMTRTVTPSITRTITSVNSQTPTSSFTFTATRTNTPTRTMTNSQIPTASHTPTRTLTLTFTYSSTFTFSFTYTRTPTLTISPTHSISPTFTDSPTGTPPTLTNTPTYTNTSSETVSVTETVTTTSSPSITETITFTITQTITPSRTATNTNSATVVVSASPTRTRTVTPILTITATAVLQPTMTFSITPTQNNNRQLAIGNVFIFPSPIVKRTQKVYLYYDISGQLSSIKIRIYTAAFRAIQEIEWTNNLVGLSEIPQEKIRNLTSGIYFYYCSVKDNRGKELKSRIMQFIVIR